MTYSLERLTGQNRKWIAVIVTMATAWFTIAANADGLKPVRVGAGPHLFVDDVLVAKQRDLTRRVHACQKLSEPVLKSEKPWEEERVYVYGSVSHCPQKDCFQMWYMSRGSEWEQRDERLRINRGSDLVLYSTSKDGTHWIRPDLRDFAFGENRDNNIVFAMHSPSVLFDPADPDPAFRYKMVGHLFKVDGHKKGGYCAAHSPDGIHWTLYPKNPILPGSDTITLSYNQQTREYMVFYKRQKKIRGYLRRVVLSATSKDMQNWTDHGLVLAPDEEDDRWTQEPPQRTEFYNMSVFQRGEQFLGLVTVFRIKQIRAPGAVSRKQSRWEGPIDVQLVHSRDGRHWSRCDDRSPIIPLGPNAYDAGSILGVTNIPVVTDDQMWFYYTAMTTTHGGAMPAKKMSIGQASWRLDGMVSLDAEDEEAVLETLPLQFDGRQLTVNADAAGGRLIVELLDRDGRPLSGYEAEECTPISTDSVRHVIQWTNGSELPDKMPLRVRFRLSNTSLYSFSFTE